MTMDVKPVRTGADQQQSMTAGPGTGQQLGSGVQGFGRSQRNIVAGEIETEHKVPPGLIPRQVIRDVTSGPASVLMSRRGSLRRLAGIRDHAQAIEEFNER